MSRAVLMPHPGRTRIPSGDTISHRGGAIEQAREHVVQPGRTMEHRPGHLERNAPPMEQQAGTMEPRRYGMEQRGGDLEQAVRAMQRSRHPMEHARDGMEQRHRSIQQPPGAMEHGRRDMEQRRGDMEQVVCAMEPAACSSAASAEPRTNSCCGVGSWRIGPKIMNRRMVPAGDGALNIRRYLPPCAVTTWYAAAMIDRTPPRPAAIHRPPVSPPPGP